MENLRHTLETFELEYDKMTIDNILNYYRNRFTSSIYQYEGDEILYKTIRFCIMQGNGFKKSIELTKEIINREFSYADAYQKIGCEYSFNFKPKPLKIKELSVRESADIINKIIIKRNFIFKIKYKLKLLIQWLCSCL